MSSSAQRAIGPFMYKQRHIVPIQKGTYLIWTADQAAEEDADKGSLISDILLRLLSSLSHSLTHDLHDP